MFGIDWQNNSIAEGDFTVEADRAQVVQLAVMAVESKLQHLQAHGPLSRHRFYTAMRPKLLCKPSLLRDLKTFLHDFRYDSLLEAARDRSSMNAVMCSVFSGDTGMLRLLAENQADMNHTLEGMSDLGYFDTQTALMAATKSKQEPSVLATLIELRANVNAFSRTGLTAMFMCRSPDHVKLLHESRADVLHWTLSGVAAYASPETVQALLECRCDMAALGHRPLNPKP